MSDVKDTGLGTGNAPGAGAGLYVHVPFCLRKCFYCDFNSYVAKDAGLAAYLQAVEKEMALYAHDPAVAAAAFRSIFVGGGTPTVLPTDSLVRVVRQALALARLGDGEVTEVTVEANPGTVQPTMLSALRASGVNRLSLGVQSLDDGLLRVIGRVHSAAEARQAYAMARDAGFANINIDLMFALPGQQPDQWQNTVEQVLEWQPEHISCYSLIIEDGTPFGDWYAAGRLSLPGEECEAGMYEWVIDRLQAAGYEHYEISNFARPGCHCIHNEIYWHNEWYLGVGPGAHSHWGGRRFANERAPAKYNAMLAADVGAQLPIVEMQSLNLDDQMDETLMMGLRLLAGVSEERFCERFHCSMRDVYGNQIASLVRQGLVSYNGQVLRLTKRGLLVANRVFAEFLR